MDEKQMQIMDAHKGHWRQIENAYQGMVKRAMWARDAGALEWAKAWRLESLRRVCRKTRERLSKWA